jgi:hypothetical protein
MTHARPAHGSTAATCSRRARLTRTRTAGGRSDLTRSATARLPQPDLLSLDGLTATDPHPRSPSPRGRSPASERAGPVYPDDRHRRRATQSITDKRTSEPRTPMRRRPHAPPTPRAHPPTPSAYAPPTRPMPPMFLHRYRSVNCRYRGVIPKCHQKLLTSIGTESRFFASRSAYRAPLRVWLSRSFRHADAAVRVNYVREPEPPVDRSAGMRDRYDSDAAPPPRVRSALGVPGTTARAAGSGSSSNDHARPPASTSAAVALRRRIGAAKFPRRGGFCKRTSQANVPANSFPGPQGGGEEPMTLAPEER